LQNYAQAKLSSDGKNMLTKNKLTEIRLIL